MVSEIAEVLDPIVKTVWHVNVKEELLIFAFGSTPGVPVSIGWASIVSAPLRGLIRASESVGDDPTGLQVAGLAVGLLGATLLGIVTLPVTAIGAGIALALDKVSGKMRGLEAQIAEAVYNRLFAAVNSLQEAFRVDLNAKLELLKSPNDRRAIANEQARSLTSAYLAYLAFKDDLSHPFATRTVSDVLIGKSQNPVFKGMLLPLYPSILIYTVLTAGLDVGTFDGKPCAVKVIQNASFEIHNVFEVRTMLYVCVVIFFRNISSSLTSFSSKPACSRVFDGIRLTLFRQRIFRHSLC